MSYTYGSSRVRLVYCPKCQTYRPALHPCIPVPVDPDDDE